jgi:hypothetical protein
MPGPDWLKVMALAAKSLSREGMFLTVIAAPLH